LEYKVDKLLGLIVIETDDMLGEAVVDSFHEAVKELRKHVTLGKWVDLPGGAVIGSHDSFLSVARGMPTALRCTRTSWL
jgi:hypothetical protein